MNGEPGYEAKMDVTGSYRKVGVKGNVEGTWVERTFRLIPCITFNKRHAHPWFIDEHMKLC